MNNAWTARELERQINSMLYERLLLSNDKESVLAVARKERLPQDNSTILASQYQLHLPTTEQLRHEVDEVRRMIERRQEQE